MSSQVNESTAETVSFIDPTPMAKRVQWCLIAHAGLALIAIVLGAMEYNLLPDAEHPVLKSIAEGQHSDQHQTVVGSLQWLLGIASVALVLQWIRMSNHNVRRLGARGMKFTPRSAVLWFFVPPANLWLPYLAMRELAKCSSSPLAWHAEPVSPLLAWWWGLLLSYAALLCASLYLSHHDHGIDGASVLSALNLAADVLAIAVCAVLVFIVQQISRLQLKQSEFNLID